MQELKREGFPEEGAQGCQQGSLPSQGWTQAGRWMQCQCRVAGTREAGERGGQRWPPSHVQMLSHSDPPEQLLSPAKHLRVPGSAPVSSLPRASDSAEKTAPVLKGEIISLAGSWKRDSFPGMFTSHPLLKDILAAPDGKIGVLFTR